MVGVSIGAKDFCEYLKKFVMDVALCLFYSSAFFKRVKIAMVKASYFKLKYSLVREIFESSHVYLRRDKVLDDKNTRANMNSSKLSKKSFNLKLPFQYLSSPKEFLTETNS